MAIDRQATAEKARLLERRGELDEAIGAWLMILAECPDDDRAMLMLGHLHEKRGDRGGAALWYERCGDHRRAILDQELANEQKNLDAAKKELAEQENLVLPEERIAGGGIQGGKREARVQTFRDKVQLHERNIESIRREINNLK